jgi:acetyl esterase/lipase
MIAEDTGLVVAAVDFPNALDDDLERTLRDCIAVARWVVENHETFGVGSILMSGESSGAHLALESLLHLRSMGTHDVVCGFYAVCGAFDLEGSDSLRDSTGSTLLIDGPSALRNLQRLSPSLPSHLRRGPLHADLQGLPPALFIAGQLDPILDDSIEMHAKWLKANGNAQLAVIPEGPHGFNRLPTRLASKTNAFGRRWLIARSTGACRDETSNGAH